MKDGFHFNPAYAHTLLNATALDGSHKAMR
jgi:hypothetical protein